MNHRLFLCVVLVLGVSLPASAQTAVSTDVKPTAWTRADALEALRYYPHAPYLQFVATQLSPKRGQLSELQPWLPRPIDRRRVGIQRNSQVNLYSIFSGSLAVRESLQLDAMTSRQSAGQNEPTVAIDSLRGPTVKSHPWTKMLGGKDPDVSRLAECIPHDHLFVRFRSVSKLLQMKDLSGDWHAYGMGQSQGSHHSADVMESLKKQWMVETSGLLRPLYDTAFAEVAITSSDLFFGEGTDATLIMRLKQPELVRPILHQMLKTLANQAPDAKIESGSFLNVPFTHVTTPDRRMHVFVADPAEDIHVRSNSRVAFERILRTISNERPAAGKAPEAEPSLRLSDSEEFRYIRTLMKTGAEEEDGFVYLSDPFIRNLIGPEKKLTQRNRLVCRSRLQMLRHSQTLFLTQYGRDAKSIEELREGGCLGNGQVAMELACPLGGNYSLTGKRGACRCSHHGHIDAMTPCCEIPITDVARSQAEEYRQFVQAYSQYWRTFFDPIAVRVQIEPDQTRIETIVLPLINNSIYAGLASTLGGTPESLDSLPVPDSNIASLSLKLDKRRLLALANIPVPPDAPQVDPAEEEPEDTDDEQFAMQKSADSLRMIGLALHNHHSAFRQMPPRPEFGRGVPAESTLSWRVQILPFIEEQILYERFHHDEPWDSEHNLTLVKEIPDLYCDTSSDLSDEGKTRFVFPQHAKAMYRGPSETTKFRDVLDGLSNTVMAVISDEENAVIWTKPDDLPIDLQAPRQGWASLEEASLALMADGRIVEILPDLPEDVVAALLTRAGKEVLSAELPTVQPTGFSSGRRNRPFLLDHEQLTRELALDRFLHQGIGNQIGIHICDDRPLVDLNISRMAGIFTNGFRRGGMLGPDESIIGLMALAINTPLYVSIPVEDKEIVDETLRRLDLLLAKISHSPNNQLDGFLRIEQDAYQLTGTGGPAVRTYAFRFGPLTLRFYWMRLDDGLYITSTPEVIGDLVEAAGARRQASEFEDDSQPAHGLVRLRPEHWKEIKPHFRIGWSESERRVCMENMAALSHATRAQQGLSRSPDAVTLPEIKAVASELFGTPQACPCGGAYTIDSQHSRVTCQYHGHAAEPRQPSPNGKGRIGRFAESLRDVRMEMTFLEEGLHAVVTVKSQPR